MTLKLIEGINGLDLHNYSQGGLIAIIAVVMVFVILALIIILTELVGSIINSKETKNINDDNAPREEIKESLDLNDEDKVVAALIASIDYRNETKKNIQVLSVREVK